MPQLRSDEEIRQAVAEYAAGLTQLEVGRMYGVSESTVASWTRAAGITRKRGESKANRDAASRRLAALADLAATGDPLAEVARRHSVPRGTLSQWRDNEREVAYEGEWVLVGGILRGTTRDVA